MTKNTIPGKKHDAPPPIPLHQVLEEEYEALHGKLPEDYPRAETDPQKRREAIFALIHSLENKRTALCLSGGGIRSGSFALGIMQGLAERGLLNKFDYLSTVSGGGYAGAWLSAWCKRAGGMDNVTAPLAAAAKSTAAGRKHGTECPALAHLRSHTQFLSPRPGLMSADTWTIASTYLRNLLLNWLVFLPFIMAALMIPRMASALVTDFPTGKEVVPWSLLLLVAGTIFGVIAMCYTSLNLPSALRVLAGLPGKEQSGTPRTPADSPQAQTRFVTRGLVPILLSAGFLTKYWALECNTHYSGSDTAPEKLMWKFMIYGAAVHFMAWLFFRVQFRNVKKAWVWKMCPIYAITGAIVGWAMWLLATTVFPRPYDVAPYYTCFAAPLVLALFMLGLTVFIGLSSAMTEDHDREWWARAMGWVLAAAAGWSLFSGVVIFGPAIFASAKGWVISIGGTAGAVCLLLGKSALGEATSADKAISGIVTRFTQQLPAVCVMLFVPFLLTLLTMASTSLLVNISKLAWIKSLLGAQFYGWLFNWRGGDIGAVSSMSFPGLGSAVSETDTLYHLAVLYQAPFQLILALFLAFVLLGLLMSRFINANTFSLHAIYRARIVRAFLGASTVGSRPDAFTGFDPDDDMPINNLKGQRPFHVVNIALNLVSDSNRAWQERKAASFTVTPLHCGSPVVDPDDAGNGYRPSGDYGGKSGISLGTAIAISGAAASPNMGYHSSPLVTFLLALFNLRLGTWLGNPGTPGHASYADECPRFTGAGILQEAFGMTTSSKPYVYLSDGGHFENLGLYEMVRRRCHTIVVSDGGADPDCAFEDLGNAIRKIRIDMGIPIEFGTSMRIHSRTAAVKPGDGRYCAIGTIRYSATDGDGTDGVLIYIRPAFYGDEPRDVFEYATRSKDFPHETTGDQFFSESQFESYRALGVHIAHQLVGNGSEKPANLSDLLKTIQAGHLK